MGTSTSIFGLLKLGARQFCIFTFGPFPIRTSEHLLPFLLQLLKDEFPEVRLNVIANLQLVNEGSTDSFC